MKRKGGEGGGGGQRTALLFNVVDEHVLLYIACDWLVAKEM